MGKSISLSFQNPSLYSVVLDFNHRVEGRQIKLTPMKNSGIPVVLGKKKTSLTHGSTSVSQTLHPHVRATNNPIPNSAAAGRNNNDALDSLLNPHDLARYIEEVANSVIR